MKRKLGSAALSEGDIELMVELGVLPGYLQEILIGTCPLPELDRIGDKHDYHELTSTEIEVLRAGGARGLDDEEDYDLVNHEDLQDLIMEGRRFLSQCHDKAQTASLLQISTDEAEALASQTDPGLQAFQIGGGSLLFPGWQFVGSRTIPHLKFLLSTAGASVAPMILWRVMLTEDVELETETRLLCPREWLIEGLDVEPVLMLLRDI